MPTGPYVPWARHERTTHKTEGDWAVQLREEARRLEEQRERRAWRIAWMAFGVIAILALAADLTLQHAGR